jgi:hypothetical protein
LHFARYEPDIHCCQLEDVRVSRSKNKKYGTGLSEISAEVFAAFVRRHSPSAFLIDLGSKVKLVVVVKERQYHKHEDSDAGFLCLDFHFEENCQLSS